ncbi:MAG: mannose-1-phosphate guanylyltransferase [Thermoanaerobaculia bacterium]
MTLSAIVLAGGSGTRFWPASRRRRPKQLLPLDGERSLLQATIDRLAPLVPVERIWISTTAALADEIARHLPEIDRARILVEPAGRNTAPAIGWALLGLPPEARDRGAVAVLPSDHRIADAAAFREALATAAAEVERHDRLFALGVVPRFAETGFGYLEIGPALAGDSGVRRVVRFTEKPDRETAERFVRGGAHLWNAGMFVFRGARLLELLHVHAPELARGLDAIAAQPERAAELYLELPASSIDYALMEKLEDLVTVPLDCGWNDLGSWDALAGVLATDADGNAAHGDAVVVDGSGNLTYAEEGTIAVLGLSDIVVVRSGKAVLVAPRAASQEVRKIVDRLAAGGRDELL